jgi:hypothetical protein
MRSVALRSAGLGELVRFAHAAVQVRLTGAKALQGQSANTLAVTGSNVSTTTNLAVV